MSRQTNIQDTCPKPLVFLDSFWDDALTGYAETYDGRVKPCYVYQAAKCILKKYDVREKYKKLLELGAGDDAPLVLSLYKPKFLWNKIAAEKLPKWENLNLAIMGIGSVGYDEHFVVYSVPLCTEIMELIQTPIGTEMENLRNIINFIEKDIVPVPLGKNSPWYVHPIKLQK